MQIAWDVLCAASPYTASPRPRWPPGLPVRVYQKSGGRCHHCRCPLPEDAGGRRLWDIDHHPIPFRDLEDAVCGPGPLDERNLVASCRACNRSHVHEHPRACVLRRRHVVRTLRVLVLAAVLVAVVLATGAAFRGGVGRMSPGLRGKPWSTTSGNRTLGAWATTTLRT